MSDRVLRGTRLGAVSYESDRHTEFAPRLRTVYDCPTGHETAVPFAAEADVPPTWECRVCGAAALLRDGEQPEPKKGKPARTHWDMLLERRSTAELEEVLAERLAVLHAHQGKVKAALKAEQRAGKKSA
jgi:rubredoxin